MSATQMFLYLVFSFFFFYLVFKYSNPIESVRGGHVGGVNNKNIFA